MCYLYTKIKTKYENSELYKKKLIKKYKAIIKPGYKTQDEILKLLKNKFDLVEITVNDISDSFWECCVISNFNNVSDLHFSIYKVLYNDRSKKIYKNTPELCCNELDEFIFLVFEQSSEYFISNSNVLTSMMILERGISEYDYINNTPSFVFYLKMLDNIKRIR